jgi:putative ABC transport system permease protein
MVAGRVPTADETASAVIGESLAEALGKKPGDAIELSGEKFRIVGIARQQSVIDDRSVMLPMPVIQRLLDRPGKVSGFHIRVEHPENPAQVAQVRDRIAAAFPDLLVIESAEMANQSEITNLVRAMAWASSTVALVMTFVVVLNTLLMAVTERMREIGLLSAIGWHPARIVAAVVCEGLLLAGAGAAFGIAGGLLGLRWMIRHPQLGAFLQPDVTPALVLESVAMVLAVGALGGIYPAWRATRLQPVELLRGE